MFTQTVLNCSCCGGNRKPCVAWVRVARLGYFLFYLGYDWAISLVLSIIIIIIKKIITVILKSYMYWTTCRNSLLLSAFALFFILIIWQHWRVLPVNSLPTICSREVDAAWPHENTDKQIPNVHCLFGKLILFLFQLVNSVNFEKNQKNRKRTEKVGNREGKNRISD